jgi:hypothetical protein
MLFFENSVSIYLCGVNSERWANIFGRLFKNFTRRAGLGGWTGNRVIVSTEPVITVTCWGVNWSIVYKMLRLARWYQHAEAQEAVSIEYTVNGRWAVIVVGENEWGEATYTLRKAFEPEEVGLALADWFEDRAKEIAENKRIDRAAEVDENRRIAELGFRPSGRDY